jgi:hypothetical protein
MQTFLMILVGLAMLATLGVFFAGMFGFVRGDGDPHRANKLMRWRVLLQAGALMLFVLLLSMMKG